MAEKVNEPVIAYKGFKRDMTCKGYQYEEGKTYTTQTADVCSTGFHACEYPLDVFSYYPPGTSVYHEVQQSGEISRDNCDTKQASTKIKIGAELSIRGLVKAAINYTKARTTTEQVSGYQGASVSGNRGASTSGDRGASVSGDRGASVSGNLGASVSGYQGASVSGYQGASVSGNLGASVSGYQGASVSGYQGASVSGNRGASVSGYQGASTSGNLGASVSGYQGASVSGYQGASTSGNRGASVSGYRGASVSGYRGASTSGDRGASVSGDLGASVSGYQGASVSGDWGASVSGNHGASVSRGKSTVGENGIAYARGEDAASVKVKGGIGSILVLVTENDGDYGAKSWKAEYVDGERIKADTWYKLKNGKFVEVGEDD